MSPSTTDPASPAAGPRARRRTTRTARERGQVLVIFAGAMIALVALCAVVVDVAWYWTSNLRMQRAADAAALAGVVWLPGNQGKATIVARDEAAKNGYTNGVDGVVVTPSYDKKNPRRIKVAITGPVGTLFARAVGINSWPAARTAKADYVLPVPMGSPQNYYGVGFYEGPGLAHVGRHRAHVVRRAVVGPRVRWEPRDRRAVGRPVDADQRLDPGLGERQQQRLRHREHQRREAAALDLRPAQRRVGHPHAGDGTGAHDQRHRGAPLRRVRVRDLQQLDDRRPAVVGRRDDVVHGRPHREPGHRARRRATTCSAAARRPSDWGAHAWGRNDFSDANFRVRLTANKGCGTSSTTLNLDQLELRVGWTMTTTTTTKEVLPVPDPATGSALDPQGFWGAMFTSGGYRENGDKFGPRYLGNGTGQPAGSNSPTYDSGGYDYTIELPGGNGDVRLFDPMFCATGDNGHGGSFGAGDHWTGGPRHDRRRAGGHHLHAVRHAGDPARHHRRRAGRDADLRPGQRHDGRPQRRVRHPAPTAPRPTARTARPTPPTTTGST